jgi:hypothetical protein
MRAVKSELTVIMKAKELCTYVVTVTQKSPKHFRFTFVNRLTSLSMDVIENIYRANEVFISEGNQSNAEKRLDFQHKALTSLRILALFAEMAMVQGCLLPKQFEQIAYLTSDCQHLLSAWINSDKKRLPS